MRAKATVHCGQPHLFGGARSGALVECHAAMDHFWLFSCVLFLSSSIRWRPLLDTAVLGSRPTGEKARNSIYHKQCHHDASTVGGGQRAMQACLCTVQYGIAFIGFLLQDHNATRAASIVSIGLGWCACVYTFCL